MKATETIQDLIEEAKRRTVCSGLCIFSVTYFLTHTSKSMWMNLPMAIAILGGLRILLKAVSTPRQSQLSYLETQQLSVNDARLSGDPPPPRWKKKIDSPVVEAAIKDFIDKILNDFVVDSWYSSITPDREVPELIRAVIMDALGEISVRVKLINIVDLFTRQIVDLIGDHLENFRRNQAAIGIDVMKTLSSEDRDHRLKSHMASGELYPALVSPEREHKVLQKIVDDILSVVLRRREAQCPLVKTIFREIVTCSVIQPLLNLACPERINVGIEFIINLIKEGNFDQFTGDKQNSNSAPLSAFDDQAKNMNLTKVNEWMPPDVSVPILNLVDKVFQSNRSGWLRRLCYCIGKEMLLLFALEDTVDDLVLKKVCWLRNEDTVAQGIRWAQDILWPNGVFFTRVIESQEASSDDPSSSEQQLEASRRASEIEKFLLDGAPKTLVRLVGQEKYRRCVRDVFSFTQSNVCIKQLTFAILELLLRSVFPELQDLLRDIRENPHGRSD